MTLDRRGAALLACFETPLAVAFSGGADSALVLAAAVRALGVDEVLAVTAVSPSYPADELGPARRFADELGVRHLLADTHEGDVPGYRANGTDRCWFCKSEVLDVVAARAGQHGVDVVATGTNADDARDPFRPGIRAGDERGVRTPLRTLGFGKDEVRALSQHWGLSTWAKPAAPCLASRIRHGVEVTPFRLARIDRAETAVRSLLAGRGLTVDNLRVRDLGDAARVELDAPLAAALADDPDVVAAVRSAGLAGEIAVTAFSSGALSREAARHD
ncbi:MAG TPA: ATP-dependent sacrificial sulfur transferase LarE [Jatrophihabitans sp.]